MCQKFSAEESECVCFTHCAVVADACGFPASIVSAGVTLIELEAVVFVPSNIQQRHTKGPFT